MKLKCLPQPYAPVSGEHLTLHQNSNSAQADYKVPKDFKRSRNWSFNFIRKSKLPGTTSQHPPICGNSLVICSIPLWQETANQPNLTQRFTSPSHLWNPQGVDESQDWLPWKMSRHRAVKTAGSKSLTRSSKCPFLRQEGKGRRFLVLTT